MKPVKLENAALIMDFLAWPRREGRGNARRFLSRPGNAIHTQRQEKALWQPRRSVRACGGAVFQLHFSTSAAEVPCCHLSPQSRMLRNSGLSASPLAVSL